MAATRTFSEKKDPAIIAGLVERLDALEHRVAVLEALQRPRPSGAVLLAAIAASVERRAFTSADVIEFATITPALAATLDAARIRTPRSLGRVLRRLEGDPLAGLVLRRVGVEHDHAIVWIIVEA